MLGSDALGRRALGEAGAATSSAVIAASGTFTLTFSTAVAQASMTAGVGTFATTFQTTTSVLSAPVTAGSFTLTGSDASLSLTSVLTASPFIVSERSQFGFAALGEVALGEYRSINRPTFSLDLQDATSKYSMPANGGQFTLTGGDATLFLGSIVDAVGGSYVLTGYDAVSQINMPAASGSFAFTSFATELLQRVRRIHAFPRVGRPTVSARSTGRDIKIRAYGG